MKEEDDGDSGTARIQKRNKKNHFFPEQELSTIIEREQLTSQRRSSNGLMNMDSVQ